jgi:hypothetical protein
VAGALLAAPLLATISATSPDRFGFLCALGEAVKKPICLVFCTFFGQGKCLAMTE